MAGPTYLQRMEALFAKDGGDLMIGLLRGGAFGLAATYGLPAIVGVAAISTGIGITRTIMRFRHYKRELVNSWRDDIGALLHKAPDSVTLEDLRLAAKERGEGGLGIAPLARDLEQLDKGLPLAITVGTATNAVMAGLGAATALFLPGLNPSQLVATSVGSFLFHATQISLRELGEKMTGLHTEPSFTLTLDKMKLNSRTRTIAPHETFEALLIARPDIHEKLLHAFHKAYAELSLTQKNEAIHRFGGDFAIETLTNAINRDQLRPTAIGLAASGILPVTRVSPTPAAADESAADEQARIFVAKLAQERAEFVSATRTLH